MNNVPDWLKVAAGIFLTVTLIAIIVYFTDTAQEKTKEAGDEINGIFNVMSNSKYTQYTSGSKTGSQVVNAIRQYARKPQFGIKVITGKGDVSFYGNPFTSDGTVTATKTNDFAKAEDPKSPAYINLSGMFEPKVVRDANSVVVGIEFQQAP
ncbi:ABC transporter permease [Paenibacillus sp. 11B]|uniref:ABC transporter permease n=1 Tax=unclassified Paenibacillus TaxID=185978 RepID=UPI00264D36C2|nr:ABC transporter permease [Paenibacillus sp. 11B]MDN8593251.1 ABC transporter permease [Paenibacillus sp. 11B]